MKEIIAIIRMNMVNKTKEALVDKGYPGITCRKVFGRGKKPMDYDLIEDIMVEKEKITPNVAEAMTEEHRLLPKRYLTLIVKDEDVKDIVDVIVKVNQTGSYGDGKIFVLPITEVMRIRTGEVGEVAI